MHLKKFLLFGLIAAVLPAVAEEAADRKTATSLKYVEHELDTRQNKFTAEQNKAMEYTNAAGTVQKRAVTSNLGTSTSDTSLPMVGGVNTKLNQKQDDIDPVNDHTAVTYTGQPGGIGQKGIYQTTESYVEQSNNLIDAKTFNAALKKGLDSEFLCSEYKPGTDLCWVWSIHNTEPVSINLFDMSLIPTDSQIVHNADGSITVTTTATNGAVTTGKTLAQLAPGLQVGNTYKLSINTTGTNKYIYMGVPGAVSWLNDTTKTITQDMLNSTVYLYTSGVSSTATIYDIQITEVNPEMPFTTLVPAGYTPVEWIGSSGSQKINPNVTGNARWVITAQANQVKGSSQSLIASTPQASGGSWYGEFTTTGHWDVVSGGTNILPTTKTTADLSFDSTGVNGTIGNIPVSRNAAVTQANWSLFGTTNGSYMFAGKVFYAKVYQNGALVRNFIPAKQGTTVGMYDTVSGEFFENVGEGDFTAGPEISNIVYIPQNQ